MATTHALASRKSGRDHYESRYASELGRQAEWLQRSAIQKADSVEKLLRNNGIRPEHLLELGCGTGAVLQELRRRRVAQHYYGVDYSTEAIQYLKSTQPEVECAVVDITANVRVFDPAAFDVAVCSHVIEHLEDPLPFLELVRRLRCAYLLVEVPLEDLPLGRLKARWVDRGHNRAGHVQFFTRPSFQRLLNAAGFTMRDELLYAPVLDRDTLRFAYAAGSKLRYARKLLTEHCLPRYTTPLWVRWYHAHYAVLCESTD